jgi:cysteine desulfurase / selenocysteine lyase
MTPEELRALFPHTSHCIHLNHAGTSPIARPVADAVQTVCAELMSDDPFTGYRNHEKRQRSLRAALGRMMDVAPETLAFTRNTSHSISIAAQAIPFQPGDRIVAPAIEYPANLYPWMARETSGATVHRVPAREDGLVAEDDLMAACDAATRVLAVSWVQWGTGQRLDLARLGAFCRERGILFAVDIVQGLGALCINLASLPVDIAAAGCHKWLLAPGGLGVLYVRPEVFPSLLPINIGWNSVQDSIQWERMHYDELKTTPERFEEGTPSLLATAALAASVRLLESVGFDAVNDRVLALAAHAHRLLTDRGMHVVTPTAPESRSGIVAFRHPRLANETVLDELTRRQIVAAVRCGSLRFAPHVYTTEPDIETAVAAIPE